MLLIPVAGAQAQYRTFLFTFETEGPAMASGCVTLTGEAIQVPFDFGEGISTSSPMLAALSVTVTGAATGNGTFGIDDFEFIAWNSNGGALNLDAEFSQPVSTRGAPRPGEMAAISTCSAMHPVCLTVIGTLRCLSETGTATNFYIWPA